MQKFNPEMASKYTEAIEAISKLPNVETRKNALLDLLKEHSQQTLAHSMEIAELMHMSFKGYFPNHTNLPMIAEAMRLHDIGKLLIPAKILGGQGNLKKKLKE